MDDDSIRYLDVPQTHAACVDVTSHVYMLYKFACQWGNSLNYDSKQFIKKVATLKDFIRNNLFCEETGFFYNIL